MANVLNFSTDNLVTGINIIDGNLYWTDNLNEPKKIEIDRFKQSDVTLNGNTTQIDGRLFDHTDITVIRPHPRVTINLELEEYTPTDTLPEPPFEQIYPRFSYRWRYEDGQYSPYAPFTQAAFLPKTRVLTSSGTRGEDDYVPDTEEDNYVEGFNTTMFNNVGKIILKDIPRGTPDVVEIDILYTESISTTIYVLETLVIPPDQRGIDFELQQNYINETQAGNVLGPPNEADYTVNPLEYEIETRKIFRGLPADQLARDFDNVPRRALAQEVTANRLIYGNYVHRYNQDSSVGLEITSIDADSFPYLYPSVYTEYAGLTPDPDVLSNLEASSREDGLHVKGNRTYEVGVTYIDSFGRIGGMLQSGSAFDENGKLTVAQAFRTPFYQDARQQLVAKITTDPPAWADSYRYYIKDVSMDHHNLISYNIYNDGGVSEGASPYIWVEFLSTDRNKVMDGTIISPKRVNEDLIESKSRHLIQEIQNEAPDVVRNQLSSDGNLSGRVIGSVSHQSSDIRTITSVSDTTRGTNAIPSAGTGFFRLSDEHIDFSESGVLRFLNQYIGDQSIDIDQGGNIVTRFDVDRRGTGTRDAQIVDLTADGIDSFLYVRVTQRGSDRPMTNWMQVEEINFGPYDGADHRTALNIAVGDNVAIQGTRGADMDIEGIVPVDANGDVEGTGTFVQGTGFNVINGFALNQRRPSGIFWNGGGGSNWEVEFATSELSEEALERLSGRFWVKVPRSGLETARSEFDNNGDLRTLHQVWFETEPDVADSNLDLFWETSQTFCVCTDHGWPNKLNWSNCVAEVKNTGSGRDGVYLESTRINDKFNTPQLVRGVRANLPSERFAEEHRPTGMIFSGIYNSRTGVNRLNEFNVSNGITKELEPNYGSLQKLHTRDTNVLAFCEDKVFRVLADKDLLFNADGGGNVSAANSVLGQTTPFTGEYGIGTSPESFANYGHNVYFSDPKRGVMCQLTPGNGQIFEISGKGLNDFFRDRLRESNKIVGMFDDYSDKYIVSVQGYNAASGSIAAGDGLPDDQGNVTLGYELETESWISRMSFIPDAGITQNNRFYTFHHGEIWRHNIPSQNWNNFYGTQYNSEVEIIFNDQPSSVINFLTLNYEGSAGWEVVSIETDQDTALLLQGVGSVAGDTLTTIENNGFVLREGKYHQAITSEEPLIEYAAGQTYVAPDGTTYDNVRQNGFQIKAGAKGFYCKVRMRLTGDAAMTMGELFSISSEVIPSSN